MGAVIAWILSLVIAPIVGSVGGLILGMPIGFLLLPLPTRIRVPLGSFLIGTVVGIVTVGLAAFIHGLLAGQLPLLLAIAVGVFLAQGDFRAILKTRALVASMKSESQDGTISSPAGDMIREQQSGQWALLLGDATGVVIGALLFVGR